MKLRALRLQAFRRFSDAVQIQGLDDGVNVLAGPNELGKSTMFHALEAAFLVPHRVSGAALEAMRPRGGGEPRVEVDFEAGGGLWRMSKQFGRGKGAALINLMTGREDARGGEAEDRFAVLAGLTGEGPARLGLVWVRQQRTLLAPDPDIDPETGKAKARGETNALVEAIGREVDAVAGGEAAARVQEKVSAALADLVTLDRKVPKKGGPLELAIRAREDAKTKLTEARRIAQAAEERLSRINDLSAKLAELDTPAKRAGADRELASLDQQIAEAVTTRGARDVAAEALQARVLEAEAARKARETLEAGLAEAARIAAEADSGAARESEIKTRLTHLKDEIAGVTAELAGLQTEAEKIAAKLGIHERHERRKGGLERLEALKATEMAVQGLEAEISILANALAADPATPERLKQIGELDVVIAVTDAQLSAAAPVVDIALKPGGTGRIRLDGVALEGDRRLPVAGLLDIDIDGIATIRIASASGDRLADTGRRRADATRAIGALVHEMGATDLNDARVRATARARIADDLAHKRSKLSGLAPQGRQSLGSELARLQEDLGSEPARDGDLPPPSELEAAKAELEAKRVEAEGRRSSLERDMTEADRQLAGLEGETGARRARQLALALSLPSEDARPAALSTLLRAFEEAQGVERSGRQRMESLSSSALTDDAFRALTKTLDDKRQSLKQSGDASRALALEIETLKGAQSAIDEDGLAGQAGAREDDVRMAESEVTRLEAEVKALGLLAAALADAEQKARSHYLEPVQRCLAPYLARVFPEAGLNFKDTFSLEAITRAGEREGFATLSDGTREQLAVLVRLGFARLLAERGNPAPLVLDDPLVYSDDVRLEAMCRALEDSAVIHQTLLLTCREKAFETLAGHRLQIQSWRPG